MSEKIVYLSNFNSKKSYELKEYAINSLRNKNGQKLHYILPNGDLLKKYRYEFIDRLGFVSDLNISTFDDIVKDILKYDFSKQITQPMKNVILKEVIAGLNKDNKLFFYKDLVDVDGFIKAMGDVIGKIKRSLIYPNDYYQKIDSHDKFIEIYYIYEEYEKFLLKHNLLDREGKYFKAIEIMDKYNPLEKLEIVIIDYFYDFRPIEYEMIQKLIDIDCDIYINMPFFTKKENIIVNKNINKLKELGFKLEYCIEDSKTEFEEISTNIFTKSKKVNLNNNLEIIDSQDMYLEVDNVFLNIKKLLKKGASLEDIGIMILNDDYKELVIRKSREENLPITIGQTETLYFQPIILEIINILKTKKSNCSKEDLLKRINSNYFKLIDDQALNEIEIYLKLNDFKYLKDIDTSDIIKNENKELILKELAKLIKKLDEEHIKIPKYDSVERFGEIVLAIIEEYNVYDKVIEIYKKTEDNDLFLRDVSTINLLEKTLEDINNNYLIKEKVTLEEYIFILEEHLLETELKIENGKINGIQVFTPVTSRGREYDYLFITGLTQGIYPVVEKDNFFVNSDNYSKLVNIGLNINNYYENIDNDTMNLIGGIARTKKKLFLSFCSGRDGNNIGSMYINEIERLINNKDEEIIFKEIELNERFNILEEDVKNSKDLLLFTIKDMKRKKYLDENLVLINEKYNKNLLERIRINNLGEYSRLNNIYDNYQGKLFYSENIKEIENKNHRKYSITYLEKYAKCPFSFFLEEMLKVEELEKEVKEYDYALIGTIYHNILFNFYNDNKEDIIDSINLGLDYDYSKVEEKVERELTSAFKSEKINLNNRNNSIIYDSMKNNLIEYLHYDLDEIFISNLIPCQLEKSFEFSLDNKNEEIKIGGRIDRIDKSIYTERLSVMDYKTSSSGISSISDIEEGLSFQLPVYILSQNIDNIVQAGYGIIKSSENKYQIALEDESIFAKSSNKLDRESFYKLLEITKKNIFTIIRSIDSADFSVKPKECSDYCMYRDICRLVEFRG